jgi:hypothetical protein
VISFHGNQIGEKFGQLMSNISTKNENHVVFCYFLILMFFYFLTPLINPVEYNSWVNITIRVIQIRQSCTQALSFWKTSNGICSTAVSAFFFVFFQLFALEEHAPHRGNGLILSVHH